MPLGTPAGRVARAMRMKRIPALRFAAYRANYNRASLRSSGRAGVAGTKPTGGVDSRPSAIPSTTVLTQRGVTGKFQNRYSTWATVSLSKSWGKLVRETGPGCPDRHFPLQHEVLVSWKFMEIRSWPEG